MFKVRSFWSAASRRTFAPFWRKEAKRMGLPRVV